jgi:hypothetical protein
MGTRYLSRAGESPERSGVSSFPNPLVDEDPKRLEVGVVLERARGHHHEHGIRREKEELIFAILAIIVPSVFVSFGLVLYGMRGAATKR